MIGACHMKTKLGSWQIPYSIDRLLYLWLVLVTFQPNASSWSDDL